MEQIIKIKYVEKIFHVDLMKSEKSREYEILNTGKIIVYHFELGQKKHMHKEVITFEEVAFQELCNNITQCLNTADRYVVMYDDCERKLWLYDNSGKRKMVDVNIGNDNITLIDIMYDFFIKHNIN